MLGYALRASRMATNSLQLIFLAQMCALRFVQQGLYRSFRLRPDRCCVDKELDVFDLSMSVNPLAAWP